MTIIRNIMVVFSCKHFTSINYLINVLLRRRDVCRDSYRGQ